MAEGTAPESKEISRMQDIPLDRQSFELPVSGSSGLVCDLRWCTQCSLSRTLSLAGSAWSVLFPAGERRTASEVPEGRRPDSLPHVPAGQEDLR